jgi:hypothetical protein
VKASGVQFGQEEVARQEKVLFVGEVDLKSLKLDGRILLEVVHLQYVATSTANGGHQHTQHRLRTHVAREGKWR